MSRSFWSVARITNWPALLLLLFWLGPAWKGVSATTRIWEGDVNSRWGTADNWTPSGVPQPGDTLVFPPGAERTTISNDLSGLRIGSMAFAAAYYVQGNSLTLSNGLTCTQNGQNVVLEIPITIGANQNFITEDGGLLLTRDINVNGFNLTLTPVNFSVAIAHSGVLTGGGVVTANFSFSTNAAVVFEGSFANTFSGRVVVDGVRLFLNKAADYAVNGELVVNSSGRVILSRNGQIHPASRVQINRRGQLLLDGHHARLGDLEMNGGGLVDSGAAGGYLEVFDRVQAFSTNDPAVIRGVLSTVLPVNASYPLFDISSGVDPVLDVQANITGVGLAKDGAGKLRLSGNNSFAGVLDILHGTVEAASSTALGSTVGPTLLREGTLQLRGVDILGEGLSVLGPTSSRLDSFGSCQWSGPIQLSASLDVYPADTSFTSSALNLSGAITGPGGLSFLSPLFVPGHARLSGGADNTYTGPTLVTCDTLTLNKTNTFQAFGGPLQVGGVAGSALRQVIWGGNYQLPPNAVVNLGTNGVLLMTQYFEALLDLNFNGGRVNLGNNGRLSLQGTMTTTPSGHPAILEGGDVFGGLGLAGFRTIEVGRGGLSDDLIISAFISSGGFVKRGLGTLSLRALNTYNGFTTVAEGILRVEHDYALGSLGANTWVENGATLWFGPGANQVGEPIRISGPGFGGTNGALNATLAVLLTNNVLAEGSAVIRAEAGASLNLRGVISGPSSLTKDGPGAVTFSGAFANNYSGDTVVRAGTLNLDKGDFIQAVPGNLVIGTGGSPAPNAIVRHLSQDQIWASVTVNGGGLLDLNGYEEYLLALTLNEGGDVQTGAGLLTLNGGLATPSLVVNPGFTAASSSISGRLGLRVGSHRMVVNPFLFPVFDGTPELDLPATLVFVDGAASITRSGAGTARLGGNNAFSGALILNEGVTVAARNNALGSIIGSTSVRSNAVLAFTGGITTFEGLTMESGGGRSLVCLAGSNVIGGDVNLFQPAIGIEVAADSDLNLRGLVSGNGGLRKFGPGRLQFTGPVTNTFAGTTTILEGAVEAGRSNAVSLPGPVVIGVSNVFTNVASLRSVRGAQLSARAEVVIEPSGRWDLGPLFVGQNVPPAQEVVRRLTGSGFLQLAVSNTLTFSNDAPCEFAGSIDGGGSLFKRGFSPVTLSGRGLLSGPTRIDDGQLIVHGTFPNTAVTVNSGSLTGDGILGAVRVEGFALLGPESNVPGHLGGELELAGLTLNNIGFLALDLFGPEPTGGNDAIKVSGPTSLASFAVLSPSLRYVPREGDVLTLIRKVDAGPIGGPINDWPQGGVRSIGGVPMHISYTGGDGNDLTLTVTNLAARPYGSRVESGNGNGLIEPDECNLVFLGLQNRRNGPLTLSNVVLRATTSNALVTVARAAYPVLPALGAATNLAAFQLRTLPGFPCNTPVDLELQVTIADEGTFALPFTLLGGTNCAATGGGCESCLVVADGQFTNGLPTMNQRLFDTGLPSVANPAKPCPGIEFVGPAAGALRHAPHRYTNTSPSDLVVTALLQQSCAEEYSRLRAAAYLGSFQATKLCDDFLGDSPRPGVPFSFVVPAGQPFEIVIFENMPGLGCGAYRLEVFGLPCPPPAIQIAAGAPGEVLVQWSSAYPDWRLQATNRLAPAPGFQPASPAPGFGLVNGKYSVTNPATGPGRFYRLAR